jgi:hypothetical protein
MGMSSYTFHMYRCQDEQVHFNNIDIFSYSPFAIFLEGTEFPTMLCTKI